MTPICPSNHKMLIECTFDGCNKTFTCQANLKDHINTHLGLKPFTCEICQKSYSCRRYLRAHLEAHALPLKCDGCGLSFTRKYNLKRHQLKRCTVCYKCAECSKEYTKKGCYDQHVLKCKKKQRKNAVRVMRKRVPSTIVACEICKAEYAGRRNLNAHIRNKHEHVRFGCKHCEKEFAYNSSLMKHMKREHS